MNTPTPEQHAQIKAIHERIRDQDDHGWTDIAVLTAIEYADAKIKNELDMAILIRRLCRMIAKYDAHNTVRSEALDFLHRKGLGGSPLK